MLSKEEIGHLRYQVAKLTPTPEHEDAVLQIVTELRTYREMLALEQDRQDQDDVPTYTKDEVIAIAEIATDYLMEQYDDERPKSEQYEEALYQAEMTYNRDYLERD